MSLRWFAALFLLVFSSPALAKEREMWQWLNVGKPEEKLQRLVSLGVKQEVAQDATIAEEPLLKWESIRTSTPQKFALLFLPCDSLAEAHLYLLRQQEDWRVADVAALDCHYDDSVWVESTSIRKPEADELLVHHAAEAWGTGYIEQHFKVFDVSDGKLKLVLDTQEILSSNPWPDGPERHERSTFVVVPENGQSGARLIEQTRSVLIGSKLKVERRYFRWNEASHRYLGSKFISVQAPQE